MQKNQIAPAGEPQVMIVDDTPLVRDLLRKNLLQMGYPYVLDINDGAAAIQILNQRKPDLVFLDIQMPEKDGFAVLDALQEQSPATFVCMLSGVSSTENVRRSLTKGAKGFLVKPYTLKRLEGILQQFRQHWQRLAKAKEAPPEETPAVEDTSAADAPPPSTNG